MATRRGDSAPDQLAPELLDAVYRSAFDRSAFDDLAQLLADTVHASHGAIVVSERGIPIDASTTTPTEAQLAYLTYYGRLDIWTPKPGQYEPFEFTRSGDHVSDQDVIASEFYQDYARHLNMWQPSGVMCSITPELGLMLGITRPPGAQDFSRAEAAAVVGLSRHIQRALQLRRHFDRLEVRSRVGFAALDRLAFAAIVTGQDASITFANTQAEALIRNRALGVVQGRLVCAVPSQTQALAALIKNAAEGGPGGAIHLLDASAYPAFVAIVSPLPSRVSERPDAFNLALVAVRDRRLAADFPEQMLQQLFGLTSAEASLVNAIASGSSLEEFAAARAVKLTTIKTQLQSVFRKTGAENQRDVVRLAGQIPPLRRP